MNTNKLASNASIISKEVSMNTNLSELRFAKTCGNCLLCKTIDLHGYGDENYFLCTIRNNCRVSSYIVCSEHYEGEPTVISLDQAEEEGIEL